MLLAAGICERADSPTARGSIGGARRNASVGGWKRRCHADASGLLPVEQPHRIIHNPFIQSQPHPTRGTSRAPGGRSQSSKPVERRAVGLATEHSPVSADDQVATRQSLAPRLPPSSEAATMHDSRGGPVRPTAPVRRPFRRATRLRSAQKRGSAWIGGLKKFSIGCSFDSGDPTHTARKAPGKVRPRQGTSRLTS